MPHLAGQSGRPALLLPPLVADALSASPEALFIPLPLRGQWLLCLSWFMLGLAAAAAAHLIRMVVQVNQTALVPVPTPLPWID